MKVARSALPVTLAHWERAGVRETVMAAATYILWGGADAMAVRQARGSLSDGRQLLLGRQCASRFEGQPHRPRKAGDQGAVLDRTLTIEELQLAVLPTEPEFT
jgi:hypothetical protein